MKTAALAAAGGIVAGSRDGGGGQGGARRRQPARRLEGDAARKTRPAEHRRQPLVLDRRPRPRPLVPSLGRPPRLVAAGRVLEVEVRPPWPYRLPRGGGRRRRDAGSGAASRRACSTSTGDPVVVRAWQRRDSTVVAARRPGRRCHGARERLERRDRAHALRARRRRRLHGLLRLRPRRPARRAAPVSRRPWVRPRRRPWPWEALAWAVTEQLIDVLARGRDPAPHRRPLGPAPSTGARVRCATSPAPGGSRIAPRPSSRACDLAPKRALALVKVAREVASRARRPDVPARPTAACSRSPTSARGRSSAWGCAGAATPTRCPRATSPTSSSIGRLARLGRRATVEEVEEFFAPYAPFQGPRRRASRSARTTRSSRRAAGQAGGAAALGVSRLTAGAPAAARWSATSPTSGSDSIRPASFMKPANCCHWPTFM